MPAEGKITLDAKQYEAMLAQVQTKTEAATGQMGKNVDKLGKNFGKVGSTIGSVAGSAPAQFGQIGSAISALVMGPMGALVTVIGTIVAAAADMWDKMTLSSEELAKRSSAVAAEVEKDWARANKQHVEDQGYMRRLDELARKEALSNESKTEAARLINMLSSRYGNLGISIDAATGKIVGFDAAQKRMFEQQQRREMELQQRRVKAGRTSLAATIASRTDMSYTDAQVNTRNLREARAFWMELLQGAKRDIDVDNYSAILAAIDKQMELEDQLKYMRETGGTSPDKDMSSLRRDSERTQRKTDWAAELKQEDEYQSLLVAGKKKEAEVFKLINDLKKQGIELTRDEAEAEVERTRRRQAQLASLKLQEARGDQAATLYEKALRASGRDREADNFAALESARAKKGSDLTSTERDDALRLVKLQRQLQESSPLSSLAISANSLTARGGGGGKSAAESAAERYNHEMLAKAGSTNTLLTDIKSELIRSRSNTYANDPSY